MEIKKECGQYLAECYQDLFLEDVNKRYRAMAGARPRKRLSRSTEANLKSLAKPNELSDIHAILSKVCTYPMRREEHLTGPALEQWESSCRQMREFCKALVRKDLEYVNGLSREDSEQVLKTQGICCYPPTNSLERTYQLSYIPKTIKRGTLESVKQKPEQEYPGAREMKRMSILHVGPTNSGKTHDALERPKGRRHGVCLGPLRLLALKVYDELSTEGLSCSTVTGEEILEVPGAVCQPYIVEMLNDHEYFDIVVVDECQTITGPYHGRNWTRAVLGLRAKEIHLCMVSEAENIMVRMIKRCGDRYRVVRHKRSIRLTMEKRPYNLKRDLKKGDALIVFSEKSVLALAAYLENEGIRCSVIYGSLPPATRREQVYRSLARETEVVVNTDATGMGLNLPICRIVFAEIRKFDGVNKRALNPEEIRQIAGRAGRYDPYGEGFVAAIDEAEVIKDGLPRMPMPIAKAYVGPPEQLLNLPVEIDTPVKIWTGMDTPSTYEKMEVDELLVLYMSSEHVYRDDMGGYSRQEIYKLITCSIDIDNRMVVDLWKDYCWRYRDMTELEFPYSPGEDLYELESYYKMLGLYFQFSRKVGFPVQAENLAEERRGVEEEISRILRTGCASHTRKCSVCDRELSWDYPLSTCGRCFERSKISRGRSRSGLGHAAGNRV